MILAAPLVIPFAEAVGISIATLGMAKAADMVNDYIQENPEESAMILKTLVPNLGIGEIFMNKEKISLEDLDEMTDEEAQDLSKEEKAELMKQAGKKRNRELSIATSEKIGLSGPGKEKQDIEYEIDERYDEGGVEQKKAPFDYTKFFRKRRADGGAIGIEVLFEEKKPRKNFFMGGPALEGQALSVYESMNAYGFSDQEIANALEAQGLYTPGSTTTTTPVINQAPNIINQGGGGGGGGGGGITTFDKGFSSQNFGLGSNKDVVDYEAEAYNIGPTFRGQIAKAFNAFQNIPTPFNIARMGIQKAIEFTKQKQIEKEMQQAAIARDIAQANKAAGTGGYQAGYGSDFMDGGGRGTGMGAADKGGSDSMGSFKRGGLATMFTRKR
jgi:hypothetical protein